VHDRAVTRWRKRLPSLASPMSRHPKRFAIVALTVGALGALGLLRFSVDSGQSLLVGSNSSAGQTYARFSSTFGSDPIVIVFTARNPTAPYIEANLERLGALEIDLAHDPRVASVLGPGTVAGSLRQAALAEVNNVIVEYPRFVADTQLASQLAMGNTNQQQLAQMFQTFLTDAQAVLGLDVAKAASDAHNARATYMAKQGDQVIDSREKAVDAAVAHDALPPLWAQYLAGPGRPTDQAGAQILFARVSAALGECDSQIATLLRINASCQVFFERTLLDLPKCPTAGTGQFCAPKPEWAAVLPAPQPGGDSTEIITIRLKPQFVGGQPIAAKGCPNPCDVASLVDKINNELVHGIANDAYTQALGAGPLQTLRSLGPLHPSECGGASAQQDAACNSAYHDAQLADTIAGAPLLGLGVVRSITQLLAILFPVAVAVMLLILVGLFRVRGRIVPLVAAAAATVLTVGIALVTGTPVTPAVLAGVPVLVGLAVDYAVQFVARYNEERASGADVEPSLRAVLEGAGRATLVAVLATVAGLAALALFSGIDWGPLVAVPLVAEFALVLVGGVILAWLGALLIALPLAVWSEQRRRGSAAAERAAPARMAVPSAGRTIAIADHWRGVVALASTLALVGWLALHIVPVQTEAQRLVSPSLPELANVETVQALTGYTNEIDVYVQGQVAGPYNQPGTPANIQAQCQVTAEIRADHHGEVATATSIADFFIASASTTSPRSGQLCVQASPSPSGSPSPTPTPVPGASPSPTASPSAGASPTSARHRSRGSVLTAVPALTLAAATAPASLSPSASASPGVTPTATGISPSSSGTPSASPSTTPKPSSQPQTAFLCELRLFPLLSHVVVAPISPDTQPCPPVDEYQQAFLSADATPIDPNAARIALGVHSASVADEARLVDELRRETAKLPNGLSASPTGLAVLATTAYDNLVNRSYLLNLAPLGVVAVVLFAVYREPRRAFLPLLPTVLAAGWGPLVLLLLGRLPGDVGATLGSLNPLTVVLGALVIALGTEFGVMLLSRFYEERQRGLDPDAAAAAALGGVGRAIRVSALTLGAGFAVLAISGVFPNSFPMIADFGLAVVIDLGLAVGAVFLVMLPLAVALERRAPLRLAPPPAAEPIRQPEPKPAARRETRPPKRRRALPQPDVDAPTEEAQTEKTPAAVSGAPPPSRRGPRVSGRRTTPHVDDGDNPASETVPQKRRRPGVSGRRRGPRK
jgi:predicted RND superfamily exporter protein